MELITYKLDADGYSTGEVDKKYNIQVLKVNPRIAKEILDVIPEDTLRIVFALFESFSGNNQQADMSQYENVAVALSDFIFKSFDIICPVTRHLLQHNRIYINEEYIENIDLDVMADLYIFALKYTFRKFIKN